MGATRVCALVTDLMDRSRISGARPDVEFVVDPAACAGADVVIIDLTRAAGAVTAVRAHAPAARVIAFGPHVDTPAFAAASAAGADVVLPRSRFFRDIEGSLA
jgi:hypothetical protein